MDLLWRVGARAKEILSQKDESGGNNETQILDAVAEMSQENKVAGVPKSEDGDPTKSERKPTPDAISEKSSTPEYDNNDDVSNKGSERIIISGIGSAEIKDVSLKAVESAKSIGSFLYGVANRTGRSISETAKHLKQTVEQNSILGDLNKEQETFLNNKVGKLSNEGLPPWIGCEDEENVKQQILSLSTDKRNFLRNPPSGVVFEFNFDEMYPVAMTMLKEDVSLEKMRFELVPKLVCEENFWRNYFYRVSLLKQSTRLSSMSHQKSSSGESSTWSSKKSSDESHKDAKSRMMKMEDIGGLDNPNLEFVSDDYQDSHISAEDIMHGMKSLGVTSKDSKDEEFERELQQELQGFEFVPGSHSEDDPTWEKEIDHMLGNEKIKDIV